MAIVRVLMQLLHTLVGLFAAALVGALAAWAYPQGTREIWWVTYAAMIVVAILSIGPVRRAIIEAEGTRDDR